MSKLEWWIMAALITVCVGVLIAGRVISDDVSSTSVVAHGEIGEPLSITPIPSPSPSPVPTQVQDIFLNENIPLDDYVDEKQLQCEEDEDIVLTTGVNGLPLAFCLQVVER